MHKSQAMAVVGRRFPGMTPSTTMRIPKSNNTMSAESQALDKGKLNAVQTTQASLNKRPYPWNFLTCR